MPQIYVPDGFIIGIEPGFVSGPPTQAAAAWILSLAPKRYAELGSVMTTDRDVAGDWIEENGGDRDWLRFLYVNERFQSEWVRPVVKVGSRIRPDNWGCFVTLEPGLPPFCDYYVATGHTAGITHVAVNIKVTGKTPQMHGYLKLWRIRITFVGDGEPDVRHGGWLLEED